MQILCIIKTMLHVNEDLIEIDKLVDKLVCDFVSSDRVKEYRNIRRLVENDDKLQKELVTLKEGLEFVTFRPELKKLQRTVNLNPKVYALKLAENDLQACLSMLAKKLASEISETISVDQNSPLKEGSHHQHKRNN